jgi:hypothetical protein
VNILKKALTKNNIIISKLKEIKMTFLINRECFRDIFILLAVFFYLAGLFQYFPKKYWQPTRLADNSWIMKDMLEEQSMAYLWYHRKNGEEACGWGHREIAAELVFLKNIIRRITLI